MQYFQGFVTDFTSSFFQQTHTHTLTHIHRHKISCRRSWMLFKEPAVIQISHYYNCYGHIKVLLGSFLLAPYVSSNKSHETDWWDGRGLLLDSKPASLFLSLVYEQQLLRSWASCRLIYSQIQIRCPVRLDWPPRATCLNAKQSISDAAFSDLLTYSKQTAQCPACFVFYFPIKAEHLHICTILYLN